MNLSFLADIESCFFIQYVITNIILNLNVIFPKVTLYNGIQSIPEAAGFEWASKIGRNRARLSIAIYSLLLTAVFLFKDLAV